MNADNLKTQFWTRTKTRFSANIFEQVFIQFREQELSLILTIPLQDTHVLTMRVLENANRTRNSLTGSKKKKLNCTNCRKKSGSSVSNCLFYPRVDFQEASRL